MTSEVDASLRPGGYSFLFKLKKPTVFHQGRDHPC
jgi:hypothetical protein